MYCSAGVSGRAGRVDCRLCFVLSRHVLSQQTVGGACVLVAAWLEQPNQIEGTVSHLLLVLALLLRSAFVLIEFLVMLHDIRICVHKTEYNFVHCRQQAIFKVGT